MKVQNVLTKISYIVVVMLLVTAFMATLAAQEGSSSANVTTGGWQLYHDFADDDDVRLRGIDMVSAHLGWAVGYRDSYQSGETVEHSVMLRYTLLPERSRPFGWERAPSPWLASLQAVSMVSANDGWAVGRDNEFDSFVLRYVNEQWQPQDVPNRSSLRAVSAVDSQNVWAVGADTILHYNGVSWIEESLPSSGLYLRGVDMVSATDGWAVGERGKILHYNGSSWVEVSSPTSSYLNSVEMVSSNDGWAAGKNMLHYNGNEWRSVSVPTSSSLSDISMVNSNEGFAVGTNGTILHYNGVSWNAMSSPTDKSLYAVSAVIGNDGLVYAWAVGHGVIVDYIGAPLPTPIPIPPPVANFSANPRNGRVPLTVQFTDQSTGSVTSWSWNFGDGSTSTSRSPSHTYTAPGNYTVTLTVRGPGGSDTKSKTDYIEVLVPKPQVVFTDPADAQENVPSYPRKSIFAIFDLEMDTSTFTPDNMEVHEQGGGRIFGSVFPLSNNTIAFRPSEPLTPETVYTVNLSSGIRATNGQTLDQYQWSFTTAPLDLTVTHIEVTQVIQDWDNSVLLVEGKPTAVRVYVSCGEGCQPTPDVTAVLRGYRGSQLLGELPSQNGSVIADDVSDDPASQRADIGLTLNFRLPEEWLSGDVRLEAELNPDRVIVESNHNNNIGTEAVIFEPSPAIHIRCVRTQFERAFMPDLITQTSDCFPLLHWIKRVYPVNPSRVFMEVHESDTIDIPGNHILGMFNDEWLPLLNRIGFLRLRDIVRGQDVQNWIYYGMVHSDVVLPPEQLGGGIVGLAYTYPPEPDIRFIPVAAGMTDKDNYRSGAWISAHEVGHILGRLHLEGCGQSFEEYDDHPYPDAQIGDDSTTGIYGFDVQGFRIVQPTNHDYMSYCPQARGLWTADTTYTANYERLRNMQKTLTIAQHIATDQPLLTLSGWITSTETLPTARFTTGYTSTRPSHDYVTQDGDYIIELQNSSQTVLFSHTFSLASTSEPSNAMSFLEVLPYDPATARIVLKSGTTEIATRLVSANAPQVTLLSPNGGETLTDTVTVTWQGSDADGDQLTYFLDYSVDGGASWKPLTVGTLGNSYEMDASLLPGAKQAMFRIVATDGVNTSSDSSDAVFTIPDKAPLVYIEAPTDGETIDGVGARFTGYGYDAEDHSLSGTNLAWSSDRDGALGTGSELVAPSLSGGEHVITLTATDSDDNVVQATVTVQVPYRIHLPLISD